MADKIYIEPLLPEVVKRILEIEKPDALLAGMGGQTALNLASALAHDGSLDQLGVELIGCDLVSIDEAEDRDLFKKTCEEIGLPVCKGIACSTIEEVLSASNKLGGFPLLIRPAFTLGGLGGGTAFNTGQLVEIASQGILHSAIGQVLVEESILGCEKLWCLSHDENRCQTCGSSSPRCKDCSDKLEIQEFECYDCAYNFTPLYRIEKWETYKTTGTCNPFTKRAKR